MRLMDDYSSSAKTDSFYEILDYEFARAARYGNDVSLMFIKLDSLDEIGKNYGQVTAEYLVGETNRLIRKHIRRSDREFIYGDNEFMILLPNTPKDGALQLAPKLKRVIEGHPFSSGKGTAIYLTPQFGIASYPRDVRNIDGVTAKADNL